MDPYSGRYVELSADLDDLTARTRAADELGVPTATLVKVEGTREAVEELARRVRLGEAELSARKARRKAQRAARRRNR